MVAGSARMLNVERQLDRNGHPTAALPSADAVGGPPTTFITNGGVPQTWSWRDTNANGEIMVSLSGFTIDNITKASIIRKFFCDPSCHFHNPLG
jgi:hypothetical protein